MFVALVVPPLVDWNQFRDRFERELSQVLGQPVLVRGQTSLRLLPSPSVEFSDIIIGSTGSTGISVEDTVYPTATIARFQINIELAPLLRGDIEISNMGLVRPKIRLHIGADGYLNFGESHRLEDTLFSNLSSGSIRFSNIFIRDGNLELRDTRFNRDLRLDDVDLTASSESISGPWHLEGTLDHSSQRYFTRISTRPVSIEDDSYRLPLTFHLAPSHTTYDLDLNGAIIFGNGVPRFSGDFRVHPPLASSAPPIWFPRPETTSSIYTVLEGNIDLSAFGALVNEYEIKMGSRDDPYIIDGTAFANFDDPSNFQITANGQQLSLDRLEKLELFTQSSPQSSAASTLASHLESADTFTSLFSRLPSNGNIMLNLPAFAYGDTFIRDIVLDASSIPDTTGWHLNTLEANLPGLTTILANGDLHWDGVSMTTLDYSGNLVLATRQPSGLSRWLTGEVPDSLTTLSVAGLESQAKISNNHIVLEDLELALGDSILKGDFSYNFADKTEINLSSPSVELSDLLPLFDFPNSVSQDSGDLSISLSIDTLSLPDTTASDINLQANFTDSLWQVPNFQIKFSNSSILSSELLERFDVELDSLDYLESFLHRNIDSSPSDLNFSLHNDNSGWQLESQGILGDADFTATITPTISDIKLDYADSSNLLTHLGFSVVPLFASPSGLLHLTLESTDTNIFTTNFLLEAGVIKASGSGTLGSATSSHLGDFQFRTEFSDLDQFLLSTGFVSSSSAESLISGRPAMITGNVSYTNSNYIFENIEGNLDNYDFSTNLSFAYDVSNQLCCEVSGNIIIPRLPLSFFSDLAFSDFSFFTDLSGSVSLSSSIVELSPESFEYIENATTNLSFTNSDLLLSSLQGDLLGGTLSGDITLSPLESSGLVTGLANGQLTFEHTNSSRILSLLGLGHLGESKLLTQLNFETMGTDSVSFSRVLNGEWNYRVIARSYKRYRYFIIS